MPLEPDKAIIAPGDFHMRLARVGAQIQVTLDQGPQECSCRPSVDVLFRSVTQIFGSAAIGTVLTGMGQDGLRGAEEMKRAGAYMIAQDEASSVVWGMPGAIANAGLADEVLDLSLIANAIFKQAGN
jgi:two-component system chemotaxis response regulator CheB